MMFIFFFFQAEDGIRDLTVTGVSDVCSSDLYGLRKHSAAVRHQLWALGLVCSLLLPVVALLLPSWHSATLGSAVSLWSTAHAAPGNAAYPNLSSMIVDAATASSFSGQWLALILAVWALGAAFIAVKLLAGLTRLSWISAQATPITGG